MYFLKTASNNFSGSSRKSIPRKERVPLGVDSKDNIVRQKVWDPGSRIQDPGSGVVVSEFDVATYRVGYCFCISSCYETKSIKRWSLLTTQLELL